MAALNAVATAAAFAAATRIAEAQPLAGASHPLATVYGAGVGPPSTGTTEGALATTAPPKILRSRWALAPRCYQANINNAYGAVLLPVDTGKVTMNALAAIKWTFTADLLDPDALPSAIGFVAPLLSMRRPNPLDKTQVEVVEQQVGLYAAQKPPQVYARHGHTGTLTGNDLRWVLANAQFPEGYTVPKGTNIVRAATDLIRGAGIRRITIPANPAVTVAARAWKIGTSRLKAATDLLASVAYYAPWADGAGIVRSMPYRLLSTAQVARTVSSAAGDVLTDVTLLPEPTQVYNQVVVVKSAADAIPLTATRTNNDPTSPTSTGNLFGTGPGNPVYVTRYVEDSTLLTQDECDALAARLLDEASAAYQTIQLGVTPDPRFDVHDVWQLDIEQDDGALVVRGKFWLREVSLGMSPQDPVMTVKLAAVQSIDQDAA